MAPVPQSAPGVVGGLLTTGGRLLMACSTSSCWVWAGSMRVGHTKRQTKKDKTSDKVEAGNEGVHTEWQEAYAAKHISLDRRVLLWTTVICDNDNKSKRACYDYK